MRQVRLTAAMLAILTVLIAILFCVIPDMDITAIVSTAVASVFLFAVVPFEAANPPARKRVLAAGVAIGLALQTETGRAPLAALGVLALGGLVLVAWSFGIRNRRSRSKWSSYYDR